MESKRTGLLFCYKIYKELSMHGAKEQTKKRIELCGKKAETELFLLTKKNANGGIHNLSVIFTLHKL